MGRWTPLILMAGGLAILLGTLIGTWYPMGGTPTAQAPQQAPNRSSSVLPANINVNSTAAGSSNQNNNGTVAQNNNTAQIDNNTNIDQNQSQTPSGSTGDSNSGNAPIRALW
ncbi:MAG: hypothetical protein IGS39_25390 [Calothrix sp. C42_A2020_038]|nr:hypothetical protein [Calothrix sp. C42_A2020_038]